MGADGLHEMDVFLGAVNGCARENASSTKSEQLKLDAEDDSIAACSTSVPRRWRIWRWQIVNGVRAVHLRQFGGQLVLGAGNQLEVNGTPWGPKTSSSEGQMLQNALKQLQLTGTPLSVAVCSLPSTRKRTIPCCAGSWPRGSFG